MQELVSSHCEFDQSNSNCKFSEMKLIYRQKKINIATVNVYSMDDKILSGKSDPTETRFYLNDLF